MTMFSQEITLAWRRLRAAPVFTLVSALTLAVGIGSVTTAHAVVAAVTAPPPGVPDAGELLTLSHADHGPFTWVAFSAPDVEDLRRRQTTMSSISTVTGVTTELAVEGRGFRGLTEVVDGNYFELLRLTPQLGRLIQPHDNRAGARPVVVLSHDLWQQRFGGRPDVVGRTALLEGRLFEVIGVVPEAFVGLQGNGRVRTFAWVATSMADTFPSLKAAAGNPGRGERWLSLRARALPGVSVERVNSEVRAIGQQLDREVPLGTHITDRRLRYPSNVSRPWVARRTTDLVLDERISHMAPTAIGGLTAAVVLIMLICCSNLASLMVAHRFLRRDELVLRVALGATRWQIVLGCVAEVVIVAVIGTSLAAGAVTVLLKALSTTSTNAIAGTVFVFAPQFVLGTFAVALAAAAVALVIGGVLPGLILTSRRARSEPISGVAPTVVPRWRVRRILVVGQVAVSGALLGLAALFLGVVHESTRPQGHLDLDRLVIVEVEVRRQRYDDHQVARMVARVLDMLKSHSAVEGAAASGGWPFGLSAQRIRVGSARTSVVARVVPMTPAFFETLGIPLLSGIGLELPTAADGAPAVAIDAELAMQLFGRIDAVGQQVELGRSMMAGVEQPAEMRTIVGVAEHQPDRMGSLTLYVPFGARPLTGIVFAARVVGDPVRTTSDIQAALTSFDPMLTAFRAGNAREVTQPRAGMHGMLSRVALTLGGVGLAVVLAGLFGNLSYLVSQRTRETGVRLALGATPRRVLALVLREGLTPVAIGITIGLAAVLPLWRGVIRAFPGGPVVADVNPVGLTLVPVLIMVSAALACYVPARRASRIDPARAVKLN